MKSSSIWEGAEWDNRIITLPLVQSKEKTSGKKKNLVCIIIIKSYSFFSNLIGMQIAYVFITDNFKIF